MPFPVLYGFSNFARFLLHRVFKYRVNVVQSNLERAFPEKSAEQREQIEFDFYQSLTDIILETLKSNGTSDARILPRVTADNMEIIHDYLDQGRSVLMIGGHQGNWEWYSVNFSYHQLPISVIFKPLKNPLINAYLDKKRSRPGIEMVPMGETAKSFEKCKTETRVYALVADQNPSNKSKGYWNEFFGIDTVFLHGPEKYSQLYNLPTVFGQVTREKRGHYSIRFELLCEDPNKLADGELTKRFANKMEATIREQPETWLWSHKRWKHTREV